MGIVGLSSTQGAFLRADAHRAVLFCVHRLEEAERRSTLLRYQVVLETVLDVLAAAIPASPGTRRRARRCPAPSAPC